jgi:hypothetical protein
MDGFFRSVFNGPRGYETTSRSNTRRSGFQQPDRFHFKIWKSTSKKNPPGPCSSKANSSSSMSSNFHQPSCLDNCLATFGNIIVPGDRDFDKVCKILSAKSADSTFSWLYCCDLNHCGIGFGSSAGLDCKPYSTSPAAQHWLTAPQANVNEVINTCKGSRILNKNKPVEGVSSLM